MTLMQMTQWTNLRLSCPPAKPQNLMMTTAKVRRENQTKEIDNHLPIHHHRNINQVCLTDWMPLPRPPMTENTAVTDPDPRTTADQGIEVARDRLRDHGATEEIDLGPLNHPHHTEGIGLHQIIGHLQRDTLTQGDPVTAEMSVLLALVNQTCHRSRSQVIFTMVMLLH